MCTLTWWREDDRYGVLFNRDESVKRGRAEPPAVFTDKPCRSIRPVDPDGGGTWIWVNEAGMIACVLNKYTEISHIPAHPVSRGVLLTSLVPAASTAALEQRMRETDCSPYRGFYLFCCDGVSEILLSWDGGGLSKRAADELYCPLTTSGFQPDQVVAYRTQQYRLLVAESQGGRRRSLEAYHTAHNPDFPAHSVLMARSDARTVSHSRIVVDRRRISFSYAAVDTEQRLEPWVVTTLEREP